MLCRFEIYGVHKTKHYGDAFSSLLHIVWNSLKLEGQGLYPILYNVHKISI